jgi:hypothetical protein
MTMKISLVALVPLAACVGVHADPGQAGHEGSNAHGKRVFVTSVAYQGGYLGGLDGADAKCTSLAGAAGLGGTYKAWLSAPTSTAAARLAHATEPYVLVDGTQIAANWDDLVHASIGHAIDLDETGAAYAGPSLCMGEGPNVWTGSDFDGNLLSSTEANGDRTCGGWSDLHGYGNLGDSSKTDGQWSIQCEVPCTYSFALYCLEQ